MKEMNVFLVKSIFKVLFIMILAVSVLPAFSAKIILPSDNQLNDLLNPDTRIDLSLGLQKENGSLREICEREQKNGDKVLTVAFDEFFRQSPNSALTWVFSQGSDQAEGCDRVLVLLEYETPQMDYSNKEALPLSAGRKAPVVKLSRKTIPSETAGGQLTLDIDASLSG